MNRLRGKLTYSNIISTLCLVLLLGGGTAYAASQLEKESVGTHQLKKEAVSLAKIKQAAIKSLRGATGPAGLTGPQGPKGATGATGDSNVIMRTGVTVSVTRNNFATATASCQPGEKATGGGVLTENVFFPATVSSFPQTSPAAAEEPLVSGVTPASWRVWVSDHDTPTQTAPATTKFTAYVICVS